MDFVPFIDAFGEPAAAAAVGLAIGALFGMAAQMSGFCTRSAAIELGRNKVGTALPVWLLGFAVALAATQALLMSGVLDVQDTRFFGTPQSLSGAVIGGLLFGVGMVLARGCASRMVVLASGGNLRALFSVGVIAAVAWMTYQGPLVPLRDFVAGRFSTASIGTNDISALLPSGALAGIVIGGVLFLAAVYLVIRHKVSPWLALGGAVIGTTVPLGWWLTWTLSQQVFEPIQAESLSYMRPLANTVNFAASGGAEQYLSLDTGIIAGTVLGAFLAAVLSGRFRIGTFAEPGVPSIWRYATGSAFMGFGGILAVGCTIGAGFTGGAVLALSSLVGLASMIVGAIVTDKVLDGRMATASATENAPLPAPAE